MLDGDGTRKNNCTRQTFGQYHQFSSVGKGVVEVGGVWWFMYGYIVYSI